MIGQQILHYRIEALIGDGGMGAVYRGTDLNLDRPVALKVLHPQLMRDPALRERFQTEARIQARLTHPHIVSVYHFDADSGAIIMEYIAGRGLHEVIEQAGGPLPLAFCLEVFRQVLSAMSYAHAFRDEAVTQGIVHRDIKPSNILIVQSGSQLIAKVTDFGIAKIVGDAANRTATGVMVGTLRYMSPEQIRSSKDVGPASDIFSLGITLYQLLTGKAPFDADTEYDIMNRILTASPDPPGWISGAVSPELEQVILQALAKSPEDRFLSCEEFLNALMIAGRGESSPTHYTLPPLTATLAPSSWPQPETAIPLSDPSRTVAVAPRRREPSSPSPAAPAPAGKPGIPPGLSAFIQRLGPAVGFFLHNDFLLYLLLALLAGVAVRFAPLESARALSHLFLWLLPFFVVSHSIRPERWWRAALELTLILCAPLLFLYLLGAAEGNLATKIMKNRLALLRMNALMGGSIFVAALLGLKLIWGDILAKVPRESWSLPDFSLARFRGELAPILRGLDANTFFWRFFTAMVPAAAGAALIRVWYQGGHVKLYGAVLLAAYTIADSILAANPLTGLARITLLILAYVLVALLGLALGGELDWEYVWVYLRFGLMAEIIFALPGVILAVLSQRRKKIFTSSP